MNNSVDTANLKAQLKVACKMAGAALKATYQKVDIMKPSVGPPMGERSLGARFGYYQQLLLTEMTFIGRLSATIDQSNYSKRDLTKLRNLVAVIDEPAREAKDKLPVFFTGLHEPLQFNGAVRTLVLRHWEVLRTAKCLANRIPHAQYLCNALSITLAHFYDLFEIFCCYSQQDHDELQTIVNILGSQLEPWHITLWRDKLTIPAADWERTILSKLNSVDLAIVLVSARWLTSDFVNKKEMPRLYERRCRPEMLVIGLVLEACDWKSRHSWLARTQVLPAGDQTLKTHYNDENTKREFLMNTFAEAIQELLLNTMSTFDIDLEKPPFAFGPEPLSDGTVAFDSTGPDRLASFVSTGGSGVIDPGASASGYDLQFR